MISFAHVLKNNKRKVQAQSHRAQIRISVRWHDRINFSLHRSQPRSEEEGKERKQNLLSKMNVGISVNWQRTKQAKRTDSTFACRFQRFHLWIQFNVIEFIAGARATETDNEREGDVQRCWIFAQMYLPYYFWWFLRIRAHSNSDLPTFVFWRFRYFVMRWLIISSLPWLRDRFLNWLMDL